MKRQGLWLLIGVLCVIVAAALVTVLRDDGKSASRTPSAAQSTPSASAVVSASPESDSSASKPSNRNAAASETAVVLQPPVIIDPETEKPLIEPLPLQQGELPWEANIRTVLSREKFTESEKARALFDLLSTIPAEGAATCADEAVKRLPNADYRAAEAAVTNPGTYGLAQAVLFEDLMNRPDDLRLPTLVTIARNSAHPYAEPARNNLELLLGQDYGADWGRWEAAVRAKLNSR